MTIEMRQLPLSVVRSLDRGSRGWGIGRSKQLATVTGRTSISPTESA